MTRILHDSASRFARCVRNSGFPASLSLEKLYAVLPDALGEAHGMLRVVDESGEDYLYPRDFFRLVERSEQAREN